MMNRMMNRVFFYPVTILVLVVAAVFVGKKMVSSVEKEYSHEARIVIAEADRLNGTVVDVLATNYIPGTVDFRVVLRGPNEERYEVIVDREMSIWTVLVPGDKVRLRRLSGRRDSKLGYLLEPDLLEPERSEKRWVPSQDLR